MKQGLGIRKGVWTRVRAAVSVALVCMAAFGADAAWARPVRVLLTGFERFGGASDNSSRVMLAALMRDLQQRPLTGSFEIRSVILPVVYGKAEQRLQQEVASFGPDLVMSFGEAFEKGFRLERTARNRDDGGAADNEGKVSQGIILPGAPDKRPTLLPLKMIADDLKAAKFRNRYSDNAGGFLCNHVFFHLMELAARSGGPKVAGFVHVPSLGGTSHKTYAEIAAWGAPGLRRMLEVTLKAPALQNL